LLVHSPTYETKRFGEMPLLDVSASYDPKTERQSVFLVNRSRTETLPVEFAWQTGAPTQLSEVHQLSGTDPKASNSFENSNVVAPRRLEAIQVEENAARLTLPPLSFTVASTG